MMTRDQLDARHTAAIRRHWRSLVDSGGQPPQELLDELAAIADEHSDERVRGALEIIEVAKPALPAPGPAAEALMPKAAKPAPRRTPARRTAK